jgi:predicted Zn finger-like uncharacterized protein
MKVVCDSCQAKYQVPDERVAGKKLKIRCKRCGATVLIRGDLLSAGDSAVGGDLSQTLLGAGAPDMLDMTGAERASLPPDALELGHQHEHGDHGDHGDHADHGDHGDDDYEWHVSLDGDTQGPFNTAGLQEWLNSTPSGWDAHVWREGFPDWLDARACAELGPAPVAPVLSSLQDDELPTQTFNANSYEGASFMAEMAAPRSAQPVGGRARVASDIVDAGARAHNAQSTAYAAPRESASYGSSYASGGSSRPISSAPLSTPAAGGATYTPGPNPGFASGEASGLIDIRALASLARQSTTQIAKNADSTGATKNHAHSNRPGQGQGHGQAHGAPGSNGANGNATGANAIAKGPGSGRPDSSGLSYGNDEDARIHLAAQPTGFGRFDSLAPVSNSVSSNAALPLAILGGCALVAAAVLAAVLFNRKPAPDTATAPVPVTQEHQQSESSAATAMPPAEQGTGTGTGTGTGMENKDKGQQKAAPAEGHAPAPHTADDEPTVAPASVEAAESDEQSKAKRLRATTGAAEAEHAAKEAQAAAEAKKNDKPAPSESPEAMLADRAKPVKQPAPTLTVTPLGAAPPQAEEPKPAPADGAKVIPEPDPMLAAKPQPKPAPAANRSIDDLLTGATGDKPASSAVPAPAPTTTPAANPPSVQEAEDLPDQPSRDETLAAMRGVEAAVRSCAANETLTGTAEVAINVAGATGRVTSATVTGITGTVGSCIARAVRNARFPRFSRQVFSIKYPYRF